MSQQKNGSLIHMQKWYFPALTSQVPHPAWRHPPDTDLPRVRCVTIGHNHQNNKAVERAGQTAYHMFSGMIPEAVAELAQRIARDWMPAGLTKSLWINTGSESNEAALRIAKMHTGGFEVIAIGGSWHGVTGVASSASFASDRRGYGVPTPGVFAIPEPNAFTAHWCGQRESVGHGCLELGLKMFDMTAEKPAAIKSSYRAGGVLIPPSAISKDYVKQPTIEACCWSSTRLKPRLGGSARGLARSILASRQILWAYQKRLAADCRLLELSQPMKLRMTYIKEASVIIQATYPIHF